MNTNTTFFMDTILNNDDFIAFDTETGGLNSSQCALLSIAAVPSWDAAPFSMYIRPVGRIDQRAAEVNGYTPELWRDHGAVELKVAMLELKRWLHVVREERVEALGDKMWRFDMAAHNAGFDLLFIESAQQRTGIHANIPGVWHCTKILMQEKREAGRGYWPKGCSLNDLGLVSGFWKKEPRSKEHDALQDARCCKHGLLWLRELQDENL